MTGWLACSLFKALLFRQAKYARPTRARTPSAVPTPMPALAPTDKPPLAFPPVGEAPGLDVLVAVLPDVLSPDDVGVAVLLAEAIAVVYSFAYVVGS